MMAEQAERVEKVLALTVVGQRSGAPDCEWVLLFVPRVAFVVIVFA